MSAVTHNRTGAVRRRAGLAWRSRVALILAAGLLAAACAPFARGDESETDDPLAAAAAGDPCVLITREEASDYTNAEMGAGQINTSYIQPFNITGAVICTFEGQQREGSRLPGRRTSLHIALTPAGVSEDYALELLPSESEVEERGGELETLEELPLDGEEVVEVSEVATKVVASGDVVMVVVDNRVLAIRFEAYLEEGDERDDLRGGERVQRLAALILSRGLAPVGLSEEEDDEPAPDDEEPTPVESEPTPDAGEATPPDAGQSPPPDAGASPQPGQAPLAPPGAEAVPPADQPQPGEVEPTGRAGGDAGQ